MVSKDTLLIIDTQVKYKSTYTMDNAYWPVRLGRTRNVPSILPASSCSASLREHSWRSQVAWSWWGSSSGSSLPTERTSWDLCPRQSNHLKTVNNGKFIFMIGFQKPVTSKKKKSPVYKFTVIKKEK